VSNKPIPPRRPYHVRIQRIATFFSAHRTKIIIGLYLTAGVLEQISRPKRAILPRRRSTRTQRLP
jgi:hypothetical protein